MKRDNCIDSIKGIGVILVILGHTYDIPVFLCNFIYSFHMPLFFIISGYLYNTQKYSGWSARKFILNKAKSYLLPYTIYSLINIAINFVWEYCFYGNVIPAKRMLKYVADAFYCRADDAYMKNFVPVWFLLCLFISSVLFWLITKYCEKYTGAICVSLAIVGYLWCSIVDYRIFWNLPTALIAILFIYLGYAIKKYYIIDKILNNKIALVTIIVSCLAIGIPSAMLNVDGIGMIQNRYGNIALFLIASISLSLVAILCCKNIKVLQNKFFVWLGRNTMLVIGYNFFMLALTTELYYYIPIVSNYRINWVVSFIITTIGMVVFILVWNKLKSFCLTKVRKAKS